jgi:putative ABC transport system substrate-binding protein
LVRVQPDIIVICGTAATVAVQRETRTIPIVFVGLVDPVASSIVARLDRPSGNVTGFALFEPTLAGKWLELLSEIAGAQAGRNHVQPRHGSRIDFYALI